MTPSGSDDLTAVWLVDVAAGSDGRVATDVLAAAGTELIGRWNEPHRRYHNTVHLRAVLTGVAELAGQTDQVTAVRMAAWFHDAVYQGAPGTDEEASAVLVEQVLPHLGWSGALTGEVARLVRLTADHAGIDADDRNGAVLADADLAILAASPRDYEAYTAAVRQEYAQFPDDVFAAGRVHVLTRLLENPPLYRTSAAQHRWTQAAHANLRAEIAALKA